MSAERAHIYKSAAAIPQKSLASLALFREPSRARRMGTFYATKLDRQTNRLKTAKTRCSPLTRLANQRVYFLPFSFQ